MSLVEQMLALHKHLTSSSPKFARFGGGQGGGRTPQGQEMLKREIGATDKQIDRLVYELSHKGVIYGLTEEEIKNAEK